MVRKYWFIVQRLAFKKTEHLSVSSPPKKSITTSLRVPLSVVAFRPDVSPFARLTKLFNTPSISEIFLVKIGFYWSLLLRSQKIKGRAIWIILAILIIMFGTTNCTAIATIRFLMCNLCFCSRFRWKSFWPTCAVTVFSRLFLFSGLKSDNLTSGEPTYVRAKRPDTQQRSGYLMGNLKEYSANGVADPQCNYWWMF